MVLVGFSVVLQADNPDNMITRLTSLSRTMISQYVKRDLLILLTDAGDLNVK
ncbi:hypothetical protein KAN5_32560 [Pseudoalteromonas sp. KAN5]|nr:hypothetical protein KAN5_32560 [Pseudoalteromonas sp. KAN5]